LTQPLPEISASVIS